MRRACAAKALQLSNIRVGSVSNKTVDELNTPMAVIRSLSLQCRRTPFYSSSIVRCHRVNAESATLIVEAIGASALDTRQRLGYDHDGEH